MKTFDFIQATLSHHLKDPHSKILEPDCLSPFVYHYDTVSRGEGEGGCGLLTRHIMCYYIFRDLEKKEAKGGGEYRMRESVEKALEKIRPALQADGGNIELVDVIDGIVKVRLTGACGGCPMSQMTLKMGVEKVLKQQVPEVKSVETV